MKLFTLAAVGLVALTGLGASAPAAAAPAPQRHVEEHTTVTTRTSVREERPRYRSHWRTVCKTKWRHGERIRTCRRVRY